jgi:hypothetical protein
MRKILFSFLSVWEGRRGPAAEKGGTGPERGKKGTERRRESRRRGRYKH